MKTPDRAILLLLALALPLRAGDWPGFRGPTGQGISDDPGLPLTWSATENVAWKTPIPGEAWSSPVVHGDRVYVTTATDKGTSCRVLALVRKSGRVLWNTEVFTQNIVLPRKKNSFATPTPVTDGEHVYAVFCDGSIACVGADGKVRWTNRDVKFFSQHGLGASPALYHDLLIMPNDGSSKEDRDLGFQKPWDGSFVRALDVKTGKERWRTPRGGSRLGHVTPLILRDPAGDLLVSPGGDVVQGFEPRSGRLLWTVRSEGEGVVPTPVVGEGLLFTASGFGKPTLRAVRPGGKGDVTATHIAWEQTKSVPMIPSAVYAEGHLFVVTEKGIAACFEAKTGKGVWQERIGPAFSSSPILAGGRIYCLAEDGQTTVLEAKPVFKVLARNSIGETCQASPAAAHGCLFLRSDRHLYCIGKP